MPSDHPELDALETALNDASGKASALWTTFVTFELFLSITFGAVKHSDLLLEKAVSLPVFNVELPLVAFFFVAPSIFLIFHSYMFLQLLALADKILFFNRELVKLGLSKDDDQLHRYRLDTFLILQFLAGPDSQRRWMQGRSLRIIAWITLVAAPVIILMQSQVTFLPYHASQVTWTQRILLFGDIALIWFAWDRLRVEDNAILGDRLSSVWAWTGGGLTAAIVILSVCVVTFPGEKIDTRMAPYFRHPYSYLPLHDWLFASDVDQVSGRPSGYFSDHIILTDQSFVDEKTIDKIQISHLFRGRNLREAVLQRVDLRKSDFTGADLEYARFDGANLQQSRFGCAKQNEPIDLLLINKSPVKAGCTSLRHASLFRANLKGASLDWTYLEWATLDRAELQGATLFSVRLRWATLNGTQLQGSSMDKIDLRDAIIGCRPHDGSTPDCADLQGASAEEAHLEGTKFLGSGLQGTQFKGAFFEGATLGQAFVSKTGNLISIENQLSLNKILDARGETAPISFDVVPTRIWRTEFSADIMPSIKAHRLDCKTPPWLDPDLPTELGQLSPSDGFARWIAATVSGVLPAERRQRVRSRLRLLNPASRESEASPSQSIALCGR